MDERAAVSGRFESSNCSGNCEVCRIIDAQRRPVRVERYIERDALQRTVIYGVVIVSRNLERTNENVGF